MTRVAIAHACTANYVEEPTVYGGWELMNMQVNSRNESIRHH